MSLPNRASEVDTIADDVRRLESALVQMRRLSVNQKAALAAGPVDITTIVDAIYVPFAASAASGGFWRTVTELKGKPGVLDAYYENHGRRVFFDPVADVRLASNDDILLTGHKFLDGEPVQFQGPATIPVIGSPGIAKGDNVFIHTVTGDRCTFKKTAGGAAQNISAVGSGERIWVEYRAIPDLNALETACEAVIDQIITDVPVTTTTLEIRAQLFDKTLAQGTTGLEEATLSAAQTANLQTDLQSVIDEITAPA